MKHFNALKIGLIGFVIVLFINLIGLFLLQKSTPEFFSDGWWSSWFPAYIVWFIFIAMGIAQKFTDKDKS